MATPSPPGSASPLSPPPLQGNPASSPQSIPVGDILRSLCLERVADGARVPLGLGEDSPGITSYLVLVWPQLGDFDSLEYGGWIQRHGSDLADRGIALRAVGLGDRRSGLRFCEYTGFPSDRLWVDPQAETHRQLGLYQGLQWPWPGLKPGQRAWMNLLLMCAGVGSPGTLGEVWRGYRGDRQAPQLLRDDEVIHAPPLPPLRGSQFRLAGGAGFQRPLELATLRLRNMGEVLSHWGTYVPNGAYLTQRGGTFWLDPQGKVLYEYRDRGLLGFSATMARPLSFLEITGLETV